MIRSNCRCVQMEHGQKNQQEVSVTNQQRTPISRSRCDHHATGASFFGLSTDLLCTLLFIVLPPTYIASKFPSPGRHRRVS